MSRITTHLAPGQPTFDQMVASGPVVESRPIVRDPAHVVYSQEFTCNRRAYLEAVLDSTRPDLPLAYCVGDSNFKTEIDDTLIFTRSWATIPASRNDPIGTYVFNFPGLPAGVGVLFYTIASASSTTGVITLASTPSPAFTVGQIVQITYSAWVNGYTITTTAYRTVTAVSGATVTCGGVFWPGTLLSGYLGNAVRCGVAMSLPSPAYRQLDYFLPGVTPGISTSFDIAPIPAFLPISSVDGTVVAALGTETIPSAASYGTMIAQRQSLVAESSVSVYMGNIYVRNTLFVQAR